MLLAALQFVLPSAFMQPAAALAIPGHLPGCPPTFPTARSLSLPPLQLTKEQLSSVADGGSLRAAITAENRWALPLRCPRQASRWYPCCLRSTPLAPAPCPCPARSHQMLLVNDKETAAVAQKWMRALIAKSGQGGKGGGGGGGQGGSTPRSKL